MLRWCWHAVVKTGRVALILAFAWRAWGYLGPQRPQMPALQAQAVNHVIPQVLRALRQTRGRIRTAVLCRFTHDPSLYVTNRLRSAINVSGVLDLRGRSMVERFRDALRLQESGIPGLAEAVALAKGSQAVIFGTVHRLESVGGKTSVDIRVNFARVRGATLVFSRVFRWPPPQAVVAPVIMPHAITLSEWFGRVLLWLVVVLLLPVATISFIRKAVGKASNRTNAVTLGIYMAADVILAIFFVTSVFSSWESISLFAVMLGGAFCYNIAMMSFATRLEA